MYICRVNSSLMIIYSNERRNIITKKQWLCYFVYAFINRCKTKRLSNAGIFKFIFSFVISNVSQNCITYDIYWYTFEYLSLFGLFPNSAPNSAHVPWDVSVLIRQLMSFSAFWRKNHGMAISHFYLGANMALK